MKKILSFLFVLLTSLTFAQNSATTSINNNIVSQGTKGITAAKLTSALNAIVNYAGSPSPKRLSIDQLRLLTTDYPVMVYVYDIDEIYTLDASDVSSLDDGVNVIVATSGGKRYKKALLTKQKAFAQYIGEYGLLINRKIYGVPAPPDFLPNIYEYEGYVDASNSELRFSLGIDSKANIASPVFSGIVSSPQYKLSALNTAPASANATGTLGEIRVTATYIYVCTATNTWVRSALATW